MTRWRWIETRQQQNQIKSKNAKQKKNKKNETDATSGEHPAMRSRTICVCALNAKITRSLETKAGLSNETFNRIKSFPAKEN